MKNAIVRLGFCLLLFCAGHVALAAAPTVSVTRIGPATTNAAFVDFNVVFNQSVTGFGDVSGDYSLTGTGSGGASAALQSGSGTSYVVRVSGYSDGDITLIITAGAAQNAGMEGNVMSAGGDPIVTYDSTGPTVTINKKGSQSDPTSASPILFTITFNENINAGTLEDTDIDLSSTTTGAGTFSVTDINEITPNTVYEVEVTLTGSAVAGDVVASLPANAVSDPLGNLSSASTSADNSVQYITKPVMGAPTVSGITENQADLGGSVTASGGAAVTGRGVYYDTSPIGSPSGTQNSNGTGTGTFSETIGSLNAETHYYFKAYATNSVGTTFSSQGEFWTLSTQPNSAPTPGLSATGSTTMHITFPAANTITSTEGYVILRKAGSEPPTSDLPDGTHPSNLGAIGSTLPGGSVLVAILTDQTSTFYDDSGLNPCTDYYYVAVLYNWDLTNPETTNYRYGGATFNEAHLATWCNESDIAINGPSATLNFLTETSPTITSSSDGLPILPLRLRDGGSDESDLDDRKTELASITISIDHPELLQAVAYIDGGYVQSQAPAASMTFNLPSNTTLADDNDHNDFAFYGSFIQSPVVDQTPIVVTVTGATVRTGVNSAGSGFINGSAGAATSGPANNRMEVIATKLVFSAITNPINPNTDFSLTITAKDNFDNVDTNVGGSVTLSKTAGSGTFSSTDTPGGATRSLVSGTTTWSLLRFSTATTPGNPKTLKADHSGAIVDAFQDFTVESLGVVITGPTQNFCYNSSTTTSSTFSALGQIKVKESDGSDFAQGNDQTFSLLLPAGFIFDVTATPTVGAAGTEINTPLFVNYTSNNVVRVKYNVSGVGGAGLDELTINGLMVKYVGTTPPTPSPGVILRIGGTASQAGNADTDAKPHGSLTASNSIVIDFQNTNGNPITPTQTSFSKVSDPPIQLQGLRDPGPTVLSGPGVVFTGDGIALDGSTYKFYPANVNNGQHDITLTYTEAGTGCISTVTKTFTVFSSIITNLKTAYCINEAATPLGAPTGSPYPGVILCGLAIIPQYNPSQYVYRYVERSLNAWIDLPAPGNTFDPAHPAYAQEITNEGGVYVSVWYINQCSGAPEYAVHTFVRVNQKPVISFSPTFAQGVCASDDPYDMTGFPYDNTNNFDEFWSSQVGAPGSAVDGITGDRATGFKFAPQLANPTALDKQVQINYTHKDGFTQCTNEVALVVNVWAKPAPVTPANIFIRGNADVSGEFCHEESLTPFSTTVVPGEFHKWSINDLSRPPVEADEFALSPNDFATTAGVPNVGEIADYELTRIVHRQFGPHPIFPITVQTFAGCESDPTALTVEIMEPTTVEAGTDKVICEGNDLDLGTLGAAINTPDAVLGGTWTSTTGGPDGFFYKDTQGNLQSGFNVATHYHPSQVEIDARLAILRLTTNDPTGPCGPVSDVVFITINPGVSVTFPVSPVNVCSTPSIAVEGKVSNAALDFTWTIVSGGGTIPGTANKNLITTYEPTLGLQDFGGTVVLRLETEDPDGPGGPCSVVGSNVTVNISQKPKIDAGPDYDICADQLIQLNGNIDDPISSASSGTWVHDGGGSILDPAALDTQYDPDATEDPGPSANPNSKKITFTLTSNVPGGLNVCPAESDKVVITIHNRPEPPQPGSATPPTYCVGQNVDLLRATGTSLTWYDNTLSQISTGPSLSTGVVADVEKKVTFHVSQTFDKLGAFAGCESAKTPITITVNPLPVPAFEFANQCLGDYMKFKDVSTIAQPSSGTRSIVSWQWNFDDGLGFTDAGAGPIPAGTQDGRTLGAYDSLRHLFRNTGLYNIRLAVVSSDGCAATLIHAPIKVGEIPVAKFGSELICDQDDTKFRFGGGNPAAGSTFTYAWDFGDPSSGTSNTSTDRDPAHKFTGVGTYDVGLTVTTDLNCKSSIVTKTSILPYISSFPYIEPFETANHGWVSEGFTETSWTLSTGTNHIKPNPASAGGSTFWVTNKDVGGTMTYTNGERSVLYGPCVNMTALDRPVLAMDYWSDTEAKGDGAYIEIKNEAPDGSGQWVRLGDQNTGLNWYNENSIGGLAKIASVGQELSQFGWSGTSDSWKTGRFNLDEHTNKTRLRFRIVFGSNGSQPLGLAEPFDGFAMDYFKLETRNRLVLVENFTSISGSPVVLNNSSAFKAFPSLAASSEVVKIEYHTGLPAAAGDAVDAIFKQNPMDPNARASFYGLSAVPRGYIDGYTNTAGAGMFSTNPGNWALAYYSTESLVTSPLDIVLNTPAITDGVITVSGTVTAKEFALKPNTYSLYIAVVEEAVGTDAYVLRKMLPSASGLKVPATAINGSFTFSESWSIDRSYLSASPTLIAVAFVQSDIRDPLTGKREVLQAAFNNNVPTFQFTTGIEIPFLEQTALYPNPADRLLNIELPKPTVTGVEVRVIDQVGREVIQSAIEPGGRRISIDTGSLSGAVYIVQLKENGVFTNRKLLITHRH